MAARFSLHRLSQKELPKVLLCMQAIDRLSYSLCSQKCKNRIVELNLMTTSLRLNVGNHFSISTDFSDLSLVEIGTGEKRWGSILNLNAARRFRVICSSTFVEQEVRGEENQNANDVEIQNRGRHQEQLHQTLSWNNGHFSAQDWLQHCMEIYHRKSIDRIIFNQLYCQLDLWQLSKLLEGFQIGNLEIDIPEQRHLTQEILNLRLQARQLSITHKSFQMSESVRNLLIENLNHVAIEGFLELEVVPRITLDETLLTNTSQLHLLNHEFSEKELNRFVKSWMRGACRRLKVLCIELMEEANADIVLKGIPHTEMTREDLIVKVEAHNYTLEPINLLQLDDEFNIFNIRAKDGREATVAVFEDEFLALFQLFIWQ